MRYLLLLFPALVWLYKILLETRFADNDLFARVAVGRLIHRNGSVPLQDPFSFAVKNPIWYDHEWLSGYVFYLSSWWGDTGLLLMNLAFLTVTAIVLLAAQRSSWNFVTPTTRVLWLFLLLIPSLTVWVKVIRARVFTFLLLALLYWVFRRWREGKTSAWLVVCPPLLFIIWVNSHGGFVVGLGLFAIFLGLAVLERLLGKSELPLKAILLSFFASTLTPLANPYGPKYLEFIFHAIRKKRELIVEWAPVPLSFSEFFHSGYAPILFVVAIIAFGMWRERKTLSLEALLFLAVTLYYGLKNQRLVPLFYLTAAVYALPCFAAILKIPERYKKQITAEKINSATKLLISAACCWAVVTFSQLCFALPQAKLSYHAYPVQAMEWLLNNYNGGKILAPFNQASYVLWRGYPEFLVAIDGRYEEVYPEKTILQALSALDPYHSKHQESLKALSPDFIFLWRGEFGQSTEASAFGAPWKVIYRDKESLILGKEPTSQNSSSITEEVNIWHPRF